MAAVDHLHPEQVRKYLPKPVPEGSWLARQPRHEAGDQYVSSRQRLLGYIDSGYDVRNLSNLNYRGPGHHNYTEHQAILTREAIGSHNEAVDVLHGVHGVNVGAPDYFHDPTRAAITAKRKARGSKADPFDPRAARRVYWGPG